MASVKICFFSNLGEPTSSFLMLTRCQQLDRSCRNTYFRCWSVLFDHPKDPLSKSTVSVLPPPLPPSSLRWGIVSSWWAATACGRKWSSRPPTTHSPCRSRWALRKALLSPSTTWPPTWCCLRWPIWGRARAFSSTWQQVKHTQHMLIQWVFLYCIFSPSFGQIPSIQTISLKKTTCCDGHFYLFLRFLTPND